jgi:phosphoribosylformylglycinamidine synthase
MFLKQPGNALYLIGATGADLGGSLAARLTGVHGGRAPQVELERARDVFRAVHRAVRERLVQSVHDLSDGGLAVALAEMALAGNLGASVSLDDVPIPAGALDAGTRLFSESPTRFLVEVAPGDEAAFAAALAQVPVARIGEVSEEGLLTILERGQPILQSPVDQLKATWQATLADSDS